MYFGERKIQDLRPGSILAHSIRAGNRQFKKGHVLTGDDLDLFQHAQIQELSVAILDDTDVHEDEAASHIATAVTGGFLDCSKAFTGRVNLMAAAHGLLEVDELLLNELNQIDEAITVATLPRYEPVVPNQMVATIKIIPFAVSRENLLNWEGRTSGQPKLIELRPFRKKRVKLLQTVLPGTAEKLLDKTIHVLEQRLLDLGSNLQVEKRCPHQVQALKGAMEALLEDGPDILLISGASAITDRRDIIPQALEAAGGRVEQVGMPVDPGNLLMLGNYGGTAVIGMPGCARSPKLNGFDWVLQRLCTDIKVTAGDIRAMGVGGLLKEIPSRPLPRAEIRDEGPAKGGKKIIPLVMAAGRSSRMEEGNKLLTVFRSKALLSHVMDMLQSSKLESAVAVSGHQYQAVEDLLAPYGAQLVHNPDYADGMSSSLRRGIAHMPVDCDGVLVCLGDMPLVRVETIHKLVAEFDPVEGRGICMPVYEGRRGNPVLIGRRFFSELLEIRGDRGARDLIRAYPEQVHEVSVDDPGVLVDLDDRAAFEREA